MTLKMIRYGILGCLPLICMTAAAQQVVGVGLSVGSTADGTAVPDGAPVRDCFAHNLIAATAFAATPEGELDSSMQCVVTANTSGTTLTSAGQVVDQAGDLGCATNRPQLHRVRITDGTPPASNASILCSGTNPSDPTGKTLTSLEWDSNVKTGQNITTCTAPAQGPDSIRAPRTQYSTDGGKHYGACMNRQITAVSFGQGHNN